MELIGSWHGQELETQEVIADKTFPSIFMTPFKSVLFLECGLLSCTQNFFPWLPAILTSDKILLMH